MGPGEEYHGGQTEVGDEQRGEVVSQVAVGVFAADEHPGAKAPRGGTFAPGADAAVEGERHLVGARFSRIIFSKNTRPAIGRSSIWVREHRFIGLGTNPR
jgi:hypothetical protein